MRRILVPLDGSRLAEAVLPYAKEQAAQFSATVYLLRVVPPAHSGATGAVSSQDIQALQHVLGGQAQIARNYLEEQANKLRGKGLAVELDTREGTAAEQIIEYARSNDIDMIAISTHGRSGQEREVLGSVFDEVMRQAGKPVLVVKPS